jgi:hypothetical protein
VPPVDRRDMRVDGGLETGDRDDERQDRRDDPGTGRS